MQFRGLAFVFLLTSPLWAQSATLRGVVTDVTGAVVPGAKVTVKGPAGPPKSVLTSSNGSYSFSGLLPGSYTVSASAPELSMQQPAKVTLTSGTQTLNLQLQVATTRQQVTVQENAGPTLSVSPESNASGLVLRGQDLDSLSDDPEDLQADLQALAGPSAGPSGGAIYIDGFSGGELPPKDSIREIRINQNPFAPEWDKLGYGRIEIFTKPGTDKLHGSGYYNLGDDVWNARNPYAAQKAPFLLNEMGLDLSGPLSRRASFVVDARHDMVDNGSIVNAFTLNNNLGITPFTATPVTPQRRTMIAPRIDYQLSTNNTLTVRYQVNDSNIENAGIGAFDLLSRAYHVELLNQTVQATETAVLNTNTINETRFQYFRSASQIIADNSSPEVQVLGSFNGGGAQTGHVFDTQNSYELQNYTTMNHSTHTWKFGIRVRGQTDGNISPQNFGGTFTFGGGLGPELNAANQEVLGSNGQPVIQQISSIEQYRRTLLFEQMGLPAAQIRALGGGPTQFSIAAGTPGLYVQQGDIGAFVGDDWRLRPNITLSLGVRYEAQTNINDLGDIAPRLGFAWGLGRKSKTGQTKTVLRAGFGTFYDRFALANVLTAQRFNGLVQQQYVVNNPEFYPNIPPLATLAGFQTGTVIQEIDSHFHAPYLMQGAVTLERQLSAGTTMAITYTGAHGLHQLRSADINAPLPGTYDPNKPGSGVFPYGTPNPIFLMESTGIYNQDQMIVNVNSRLSPSVALFGWYVLNHASSNTDGIGTFPANPYSMAGEYGPAATDVRNRLFLGGALDMKWNVKLSPFIILQSGAPYNITIGRDLYGDTLFNTRPGIPTNLNKPGLVQTPYGLLDPNPSPGEALLPRNFGVGPGMILLNLRIAKVFGFGPSREGPSGVTPHSHGGRLGMAGGGGMHAIFGPPTTSRRYNLSVSIAARNIINHNNPGPIIGNITSPLFGEANSLAGGFGPGGGGGLGAFSENADNRRMELQLRFTF